VNVVSTNETAASTSRCGAGWRLVLPLTKLVVCICLVLLLLIILCISKRPNRIGDTLSDVDCVLTTDIQNEMVFSEPRSLRSIFDDIVELSMVIGAS